MNNGKGIFHRLQTKIQISQQRIHTGYKEKAGEQRVYGIGSRGSSGQDCISSAEDESVIDITGGEKSGMREPAFTLEQKHVNSIARLGKLAVSTANSHRRLVCYAVAILRELNRSDSENHRQKILKSRELQRRDQTAIINIMYPLRNTEEVKVKSCPALPGKFEIQSGKSELRKAA